MTRTRIALFAAALGCLASPALAGSSYSPWNPWLEPWTCTAFENTHRCNALWHPRSAHCRCMGVENMGWRLNEYYGPKHPPPRDVSQ
jgi:hypothetical protein